MTATPLVEIVARELTVDGYAPYGDVVTASPRGEPGSPANRGTARRFDRLVTMENPRGEAAPLDVCVFRCTPAPALPVEITMLERHAASTQVFVPMNARRYLVVVALGGDRPDLATIAAFVAGPTTGVSYRRGVWHHPMIALDAVTDFACLVHEDGSPADCDVCAIPPTRIAVPSPSITMIPSG